MIFVSIFIVCLTCDRFVEEAEGYMINNISGLESQNSTCFERQLYGCYNIF